MSTPATPSAPTPAGENRKAVPVDATGAVIVPSFEDRLRSFWQNNSKIIAVALVVVLLAIAAKGGWEYMQAQKEREIGQAYAAATTPAQLKAFIAEHPEHTLAGVAHVRAGDEAYGENRFADAIGSYEQGARIVESGPVASRARLGAAMSKLQGGREADGVADLKALANDADEPKSFRAQAAYNLASHAFTAGKSDDVKTYTDLLSQIDLSSPWTQRALAFRAAAPAPAGADASGSPAIQLPGAAK